MNRTLLALLTLGVLTGGASAAPPTEAQQAEFYKTCIGISQNETLCACKRDATVTLIDSDFMAVVIKSMRDASLDPKYAVAYNDYIVGSTRACGMGM